MNGSSSCGAGQKHKEHEIGSAREKSCLQKAKRIESPLVGLVEGGGGKTNTGRGSLVGQAQLLERCP